MLIRFVKPSKIVDWLRLNFGSTYETTSPMDGYRKFLTDNGATGETLHDMERSYLKALGFENGTMHDTWNDYLNSLGVEEDVPILRQRLSTYSEIPVPVPFNPLSDWSLPPVHAFSTADPYWIPPADAGSVSSWRNGGSAVKGAYIGAKGLALPGLITDYATTPDTAALDITGDITLVADVTATDWTPALAMSPLAKSGAGQGSYAITLLTTGYLRFFFTADGTTALSQDSTAPVDVENGTRLRVATTLDVDNGAGGHDVKFWTSTDGTTWTQLGATVTTAGTTSVYSGTAELWFGRSTTANLWIGTLHRIKVYSGVHDLNADTGGTLALDANFESATEDATSFTESSSNAATVTINSVPRAAYIYSDGLILPGVANNYASGPSAQTLIGTPTSLDLRMDLTFPDWTPSAGVGLFAGGRYNAAGARTCFYISLNAAGTLQVKTGSADADAYSIASSGLGITDGTRAQIRVTWSTGVARVYKRTDGVMTSDTGWTQVGSDITGAVAVSSNVAENIAVGASYDGSGVGFETIHRCRLSVSGTVAFDADFESATPNVSQFTESSSNAATVTINNTVDVIQATGSKQPTYDAANAAFNGSAVITFDGTDDVLFCNIADVAPSYWIVAVSAAASYASKAIVGMGSSTDIFGGGAGTKLYLRAGAPAIISTSDMVSTPILTMFEISSTTTDRAYMNGVLFASGDAGSNSLTGLSIGGSFQVPSTFARFLNGDIAAVLVFTTDPTLQPEWADFTAWVTSTYGIVVA